MPCYHALEGYLVKYHMLSRSNNLFTIFSQIAPCASYYSSYIQRPFLLPTGDPTTLWSRIVCNRTELSVAFVCASSQPPCHFGTTLVYQDLMDPIRERQFANLRTASLAIKYQISGASVCLTSYSANPSTANSATDHLLLP